MTTRREFLVRTTAASALVTAPFPLALAASSVVQTVLGPIDAAKLGFTLTHEHVGNSSVKICDNRADCVAKVVSKLKEAKDAGIDTVVDVTTFDVGRDIRFREEVSRRSGMQIVASTGQHMFAPESLHHRSVDELTEIFQREIERGIDDTDIKAGVIKVAARSDVLTPVEERVFRAAARASKATGIPIETHTNAHRRAGEKQVELFEAEGVSPSRVSLGHSDDTDDVNYLLGLAKRGYTLGLDHIYRGMAQGEKVPWKTRAEYIKQLIDAGFVTRIFLSNDWVFGDIEREQLNPDGMLFTTRKTLPYLKQIGVSQRDIQVITVENPKRFFSRV